MTKRIVKLRSGVTNARRIAAIENELEQMVTVDDGDGEVLLKLSTSNFPAGMTPDQAEHVADCLRASALRIKARGNVRT